MKTNLTLRPIVMGLALLFATIVTASTTTWPTETLNRNVIAVPNRWNIATGCLVSWRMLDTDDDFTTFDILRNGTPIAQNLNTVTSFFDGNGKADSQYQVVVKQRGTVKETTAAITPWNGVFKAITLQRPNDGDASWSKVAARLQPNDCMVGDVDGDGDYELIMKWEATNAHDQAQQGYTGLTFLSCYEIMGSEEGKHLWDINLGPNVRSGSHYTEVLVYDFDGDGKAEVICQTAAGTTDGRGNYVSQAATDATLRGINNTTLYANSNGFIADGPELLTVFNGQTGAAIHTTWYNPNRAGGVGGVNNSYSSSIWGDSNGNRGSRFFATVAYLAGASQRPSAVFTRGCYTSVYVWAVDFNGSQLSTRWLHASTSQTSYSVTNASGTKTNYDGLTATGTGVTATAYGQGNHQVSVADVDDDGKDEVLYSQCAFDDDGRLMYTTGFGHGDAMHVSDHDPDRPGLEVFSVHEESTANYGCDMHDARTGEILLRKEASSDTGRGMMADFDASHRGSEFCTSADGYIVYDITGTAISEATMNAANFPIYWDGDLQREHLSNASAMAPILEKYYAGGTGRILLNGNHDNPYSLGNSHSCNYTKSTPCLQADIFGDWREELIFWDSNDSCTINIFSTSDGTPYRMPCLMYDHTYRMGIAWQNDAYNQPPHLGYYLPDAIVTRIDDVTDASRKSQTHYLGTAIKSIQGHIVGATGAEISSVVVDGTPVTEHGLTLTLDPLTYIYTLSGTPTVAGEYTITISTTGGVSPAGEATSEVHLSILSTEGTWTENYRLDFEETSEDNYGFKIAAGAVASMAQADKGDGTHFYHIFLGGNNDRTVNISFANETAFTSAQNYRLEFDLAAVSGNSNASTVTVTGSNGTLFTISWGAWATSATVADANGNTLGTISMDAYNNPNTLSADFLPTQFYHFVVTGNASGVKLAVTRNGDYVINTSTLTSTFATVQSMSFKLGRYHTHAAIDDIILSEFGGTLNPAIVLLDQVPEGKMNADVEAALNAAVAAVSADTDNATQEQITALGTAIDNAKASIAIYEGFAQLMADYEGRVTALDSDGQTAYQNLIAPIAEAYDNGTITDAVAETAALEPAYVAAVKAQTTPGCDMTYVVSNAAGAGIEGWNITKNGDNGVFQVNTWSVEGQTDGTNMLTPFLEYWVWKGEDGSVTLSDAVIAHETITGLHAGTYRISGRIRAYAEGAGAYPDGMTLYVNDQSISATEGGQFRFNDMYGVYDTRYIDVEVADDGTIDFGLRLQGANFNWTSFRDFQLTYLGNSEAEVLAHAREQLLAAIAEAQTVYDQYEGMTGTGVFLYPAPNHEALATAISAAQSDCDDASATQETIEAAISSLRDAVNAQQTTQRNAPTEGRDYFVTLAGTELYLNLSQGADSLISVTAAEAKVRFVADATEGRYFITDTNGNGLYYPDRNSNWILGTTEGNGSPWIVVTKQNGTITFMSAANQTLINAQRGLGASGNTDGSNVDGRKQLGATSGGTDGRFMYWQVRPAALTGDVNGDGQVSIADVTALVNIILGKDSTVPYQYDHQAADVNADNSISIADVTALVNIILGK